LRACPNLVRSSKFREATRKKTLTGRRMAAKKRMVNQETTTMTVILSFRRVSTPVPRHPQTMTTVKMTPGPRLPRMSRYRPPGRPLRLRARRYLPRSKYRSLPHPRRRRKRRTLILRKDAYPQFVKRVQHRLAARKKIRHHHLKRLLLPQSLSPPRRLVLVSADQARGRPGVLPWRTPRCRAMKRTKRLNTISRLL
jgi:hypothetical protein